MSIYQPADLTDNGEPTWETTNRPGYELTLDGELGSSSSSQLGLTMENRLQLEPPGGGGAVPTQEYGIGTTVKIGAGWVYKTLETPPGEIVLTANLGQYIIINAERDKRHGVFDLTDIYGILALAQWDQGKLNFKGWPVLDAQEYLLQMYGVGPDWYDLEDLGLSMDPGDDSWAYEGGKSITDILADLANRGNKASCLWYDWSVNKIRTGCKYCRTKRTAETWASHQDNGWNSSGCRAEDLARNPLGYDVAIVDERALATDPGSLDLSKTLSAKIAPLAQGQYANRISVYGKSPSGVEISARWVDERTLYAEGEPGNFYLGFPICKVERDDNLLTQDAVNAKLVELIHELAAWPQIVNWTMPFHFGLRPGYVARIEGAQYAACHEGLYRMLTVGHNVRQRETAVTARRMYPVEESEE